MVKTSAISKGLVNFVDAEILPKMSGMQKWIVGAGVGVLSKKAETFLDDAMQHPLIKTLGIVDDNGHVDVETVFSELSKQASKTPATISIPMIGDIKLNADDVDSLYRHIMNARE